MGDITAVEGPIKTLTTFDQLRRTPEQLSQMAPEEYCNYIRIVSQIPPELGLGQLVSGNMGVIVNRFEGDAQALQTRASKGNEGANFELAREICEKTRDLLWRLNLSESFLLEPSLLTQFYNYLNSEIPLVRMQAAEELSTIIRFDERNNQKRREYLNLHKRFNQDLVQKMVSNDTQEEIIAGIMLDTAWADFGPAEAQKLFETAVLAVTDRSGAAKVYRSFCDRLVEGERTALKILFDESKDQAFREKAQFILKELKLVPSEGETANPAELYEKFDIAHWQPNEQLITFESTLLKKEFIGKKALDIGFGVGRHMQILDQAGIEVTGIDLVPVNVERVKKANPDLKVVCASWYHMPFPKETFDGAYCLGRSFPHNFTESDISKTLKEAWRVLKDEGKLIVDFPDTTKGFVAEQITKFDQVSENIGVGFSEPGTHIGTPDRQNYTLRFIPQDEEFIAKARLNGFIAEKIAGHDYKDQSGATNTNYYWRLTKTQDPLDLTEIFTLVERSQSSKPPLRVFMN